MNKNLYVFLGCIIILLFIWPIIYFKINERKIILKANYEVYNSLPEFLQTSTQKMRKKYEKIKNDKKALAKFKRTYERCLQNTEEDIRRNPDNVIYYFDYFAFYGTDFYWQLRSGYGRRDKDAEIAYLMLKNINPKIIPKYFMRGDYSLLVDFLFKNYPSLKKRIKEKSLYKRYKKYLKNDTN